MASTLYNIYVLVLIVGGLYCCCAQVKDRQVHCYVCEPQFSYDCVEDQNIHKCIFGVHDSCAVTVTIYDKDYRRYERSCATYASCIPRQQDALDNWLCDGEIGSQCTYCCNNSLCNSVDPTDLFRHNGAVAVNTHHAGTLRVFVLSSYLMLVERIARINFTY